MIPSAFPAASVTEFVRRGLETVAQHIPIGLDIIVRTSLMLAFAAGIATLLRRASAATRHAVWATAIVGTLGIALLGQLAPKWPAYMVPTSVADIASPMQRNDEGPQYSVDDGGKNDAFASLPAARAPLTGPSEIGPAAAAVATDLLARPEAEHRKLQPATERDRTFPTLYLYLAGAWLIGGVILLGRLGVGTVIVWRTARRATRVDDSEWLVLANRVAKELRVTRPITLLMSSDQVVPVTWGIIYPVVLLPIASIEWTSDRRRAVLVHEFAHIVRFDALTQTVVQLALALFWFNPLIWMAARHVRTERERACDDLVLSHGTRATVYAQDLLTLVSSLTRHTEPAFAALAMARRNEFEGRMLAILDPRLRRGRLGRGRSLLTVGATLGLAVPLAAIQPRPQRPPPTIPGKISRTISTASSTALASVSTATSDLASASAQLRTLLNSANSASPETVGGGDHSVPSVAVEGLSCINENGSGNHVHINSDNDESTFMISNNKQCLVGRSSGKITYADDDAHIAAISPGGHIAIDQIVNGVDYRYTARSAGAGIEQTFSINGKPGDASARDAWLRGVIPSIVRQDASLARARTAGIRKRRGIDGVLVEVDSVTGDYARSAYLNALLDEGRIAQDTLRIIANFGSKALESDYYKAQFLEHAVRMSQNGSIAGILATAARGMSSDYYKRQVLSSALSTSSDASSNSSSNSSSKSSSNSSGPTDALSAQVIASSGDVSSAYDRATILSNVLAHRRLNDAELIALMNSAGGISEEYFRASILDSVAKTQPLNSVQVYTKLLRGADGISDTYYRPNILRTIVARPNLTPDLAAATLAHAAKLGSDTDKADILAAIAATPLIKNQSVRAAYMATAKTIQTGYDYRRAISAVLP